MYLLCNWTKKSNTAAVAHLLETRGAMDYTIIVAASASDPASMQFVARMLQQQLRTLYESREGCFSGL